MLLPSHARTYHEIKGAHIKLVCHAHTVLDTHCLLTGSSVTHETCHGRSGSIAKGTRGAYPRGSSYGPQEATRGLKQGWAGLAETCWQGAE